MAMQVGMQENVTFDLKLGEVNGQPVLNVVLGQAVPDEEGFDFQTVSTKGAETDNTQVTIWALKKSGYENNVMVDTRSPGAIMADYRNKTAQLAAILGLFTDPEALSWNPFEGLGINTESIRADKTLLQDDDTLALMSKNIFQEAVNYFQQFGNTTDTFRVPLVRVSKKNHNPKLRDKNLDKNPIAEPMSVPLAESKVQYTEYEVKNKLNDPTPATSDTDGQDKSIEDTFGAGSNL